MTLVTDKTTMIAGASMQYVKLYFNDGTNRVAVFNKQFNKQVIADYYVNQWFNIDAFQDSMIQCVEVEFLN